MTLASGLTAAQSSNYTIDMYFNLTSIGSKWNKVLDFKNRTTDVGFYYDPSNHPDFWPSLGSGTATIANGQNVRLTAVRDGTSNTFSLFEDNVLQFSFNDVGGNAIFDGTSNTIQFFEDEGNQGTPGEYPAGFVDRILIYDTPITPSDSGVPEPGTLTMLGAGTAALLVARRRRAQSE